MQVMLVIKAEKIHASQFKKLNLKEE